MAFPQDTPPQVPPSTRNLGKRGSSTLKQAFGGPINLAQDMFASIDALRKFFQSKVIDNNAEVTAAAASYYGIDNFSSDYNGAPNLSEVKTGPGGLPGTPYVPNTASPGEGSLNPLDLPTPPEGYGLTPSDVPGSGVPITANDPSSSSKALSETIVGQGTGVLGKSKANV
jgi:hypothetical protein